jgi:hypothetical protein
MGCHDRILPAFLCGLKANVWRIGSGRKPMRKKRAGRSGRNRAEGRKKRCDPSFLLGGVAVPHRQLNAPEQTWCRMTITGYGTNEAVISTGLVHR